MKPLRWHAIVFLWLWAVATTCAFQRNELLALQAKCFDPQTLLQVVGTHIRPSTDVDGSLCSLLLNRLSKQLIRLDNEQQSIQNIQKDILENIVDCLVSAETRNNVDAMVDGTKATYVISRILADRKLSVGSKLIQFWECQNSLLSSLNDHHLSGLQWALEGLGGCPPNVRDAHRTLSLPFAILHNSLNGLPPVDAFQGEIDFQVDRIQTSTQRRISERRHTAWQGDEAVPGFAYSGKVMETQQWSPSVSSIRKQLYSLTNQYYNGCLINLYPNGESGMRYHSDPDQGTLWDHDTAVVSVGATRRFSFRGNQSIHNFVVFHGDVTYMFGDCQEQYQHTVKNAKGEGAPRISLVFKRTWQGT